MAIIHVSQIMTPNIVVANLHNKFTQVMDFFTEHKIQHLPVAMDDKLLGILSINDMAGFFYKRSKNNEAMDTATLDVVFRIEDVMTHNPITVSTTDDLEKVLEILAEGKFQAIPVVNNGLIQGIITNKDIARIYKWQLEQA